jgi:hypothetical protein
VADYPFTEDGVLSALRALGPTSAEVRQNLAALGIKAPVQVEHSCPIALYLQKAVGGAQVSVWDVDITLTRQVIEDGQVFTEDVVVDTPDHIGAFVIRFDAEDYPELIEENSRG